MLPMSDLAGIARYYERFAREQALDSPTYVDWAEGVAADDEVISLLGTLDAPRRQPNLLFAAARWHGAPAPSPFVRMREVVLDRWEDVRATMLARSTQTNEPGRCAVLLPVLAELAGPGPLALLEVGVSGGLCLYPDRYSFRYTDPKGDPLPAIDPPGGPSPVVLPCRVTGIDAPGAAPLPPACPPVAWRGGIDLNPLDVADDDTRRWLRTLVWPEHEGRLARLDAAIDVVGTEPRTLVAGDAARDLDSIVARARAESPGSRVVVFHTAVAAYFDDDLRERWPEVVGEVCGEHDAVWVSNEAPSVLPGVAATAGEEPPDQAAFCLGVGGRARAWTHGHGSAMRWVGA